MTKPAICPTCGLAVIPLDRFLSTLDVMVSSLARLEAAGLMTRRQRAEWTFLTAAIGKLRQLFIEEDARQQESRA